MLQRSLSLKVWAWHQLGVFFRSIIIKNPAEVLFLWRLSCNFIRTDGELNLFMEDKGTPHEVGDC